MAGRTTRASSKGVGAGNSAVVVDLPRWGPMLSPRVPNFVPIPSPRMERETPGQRPRPNYGHPQEPMPRTYPRPLRGLRIRTLRPEGQPGSITGLPGSTPPWIRVPTSRYKLCHRNAPLTSLFGASCENVESPH